MLDPRQYLLDNGGWILRAGIVRGYDRQIAKPGCDFAHYGTLLPVAVAAATEHTDEPGRSDLLKRQYGIFQCIRRMGIVDIDEAAA